MSVHLCVPREYDASEFWRNVYRISEEHRRLPAELRALAGVHREPLNLDALRAPGGGK